MQKYLSLKSYKTICLSSYTPAPLFPVVTKIIQADIAEICVKRQVQSK